MFLSFKMKAQKYKENVQFTIYNIQRGGVGQQKNPQNLLRIFSEVSSRLELEYLVLQTSA